MQTSIVESTSVNKVLTLAEVAEASGLSISTLRREIARGSGPEVIVLSPRRKGIITTDYHKWIQSRKSINGKDNLYDR